MNLKRRWYDTHDKATQAFEILQKLDVESKKRLSNDFEPLKGKIHVEDILNIYQKTTGKLNYFNKKIIIFHQNFYLFWFFIKLSSDILILKKDL